MRISIPGAIMVITILLVLSGCDEVYYPFVTVSGATDISYELSSAGTVTVLVENCYMVTVRTLVDSESQGAGSHTVTWDLTNHAGDFVENGLYTVEVYLGGTRVDAQLIEVDR